MGKAGKFLSIILTVCIFISVVSVSNAASLTTIEKAEVLNKLSILTGDENGNYLLDNQLTRAQAATFITRLLGQEDHVKDNADNYKFTSFTDVPPTAWYAPYVGFCSEGGIIAGTGNNKYEPDLFINEQSFIKLILVALGYEYGAGADFTWGEVYKKAYEIKLVTDPAYLTKTDVNDQFTRRGAVNLLFDSLTINKKGTETSLIEALVEGGAITEELAASTGLMGESITASVQFIQAISLDTVVLYFDKNVEDISEENIRIYQTSDFTKQLTVEILNKQPNYLAIKTSTQLPYEHYTVEIYNVKAIGSYASNTVVSSFYGFQPTEITSELFRIGKVTPVSKTSVNLYFTHPLNPNSSTNAFYEILDSNDDVFASGLGGTLNATYALSPDNMVTLSLIGKTFTAGTIYKVKVSGDLTSKYTVKLNEGTGDVFRFTGVDSESVNNATAFALTNVSAIDTQTVQLTFNKEVHPTRAQQVFNYYITDQSGTPIAVSKAVLTGSGTNKNKIIHLSISGYFSAGKTYNILINELQDASKQFTIEEKQASFTASSTVVSTLQMTNAQALDRGTVKVEFNRALDPTAARNTSNYLVIGTSTTGGTTSTVYSVQPEIAYYDDVNSSTSVLLYMPLTNPLTTGINYKVRVLPSMKDYLGASAINILERSFAGSSAATVKPTISDAVMLSSDTIKVTFTKPIAVSITNIKPDNYWLSYEEGGVLLTKYATAVTYVSDTIFVLKFDKLNWEETYTLYFERLEDISGLYTRTSGEGGNSFKVRIAK